MAKVFVAKAFFTTQVEVAVGRHDFIAQLTQYGEKCHRVGASA